MVKGINVLKDMALANLKERYPSFPHHAIPIPKYTDRSANGLTKCVIDFINFRGYQAERVNSMGRQKDNRTTSTDIFGNTRTIGSVQWIKSTSTNGTADISATIKGRSIKIEIKCKATKDYKQSENQKKYQTKVEQAGGIYILVRNFQGFYDWYNLMIEKL